MHNIKRYVVIFNIVNLNNLQCFYAVGSATAQGGMHNTVVG